MKIFIIILYLLILGACTKESPPVNTSPYPSVPLVSIGEETPPAPVSDDAVSYIVRGTEPFWSVDVSPISAVLSRPGEKDTITTKFEISQTDKGSMVSIRGLKGDFFLTLVKTECQDGMSDTKYAYKATLSVGAEQLEGCANKK